jgi:hypothetical protein
MTTLTARIDRSVRWFFDSSPSGEVIGGRSRAPRFGAELMPHGEIVRRSVLAFAAAVALGLLGVFYSVVAGAVDRAAIKRARTPPDSVAWRAPARAPAQPAYFAAGKVSLARASN